MQGKIARSARAAVSAWLASGAASRPSKPSGRRREKAIVAHGAISKKSPSYGEEKDGSSHGRTAEDSKHAHFLAFVKTFEHEGGIFEVGAGKSQ